MSVKKTVFAAMVVAILYGFGVVLVIRYETSSQTTPKLTQADREAESARPDDAGRRVGPPVMTTPQPQRSAQENRTPSIDEPQPQPGKAEGEANRSEQKAAQANRSTQRPAQPPRSAIPVPQAMAYPLARVALSYVGADADAEAYWYEAINNPNFSAQERQDLIEDLNEDGLSDPRSPTADDLPLILSRIQLIEDVAGDAMDEVNADAFQEAYKDLVNMATQLMADN